MSDHRKRTKQDPEYAVYRGDRLLVIGTAAECAKRLGVQPDTIRFYTRPAYQKRRKERKYPELAVTAVKLGKDDDDGIDG